uniref:G_PROTEIN_RECEP_F1_2 domain-containing protein n=1 Tax=Panagrellus redivivus TaxID=6233 RepID=A0A7E4UVB5_PANRE
MHIPGVIMDTAFEKEAIDINRTMHFNQSGSLHSEFEYMDSGPSLIAFLYLSYMPLCAFVGLSGNAMVFLLICTNRIFRKLPSSVYLLFLAAMSSIFLLSLLSFWVEEAHFCDFSSVWLIALVGFERLTLLYKASSFRVRRTLSSAKRQVIWVLLIACICNVWILFVAKINEVGECDINSAYDHLYNWFSLFETISCMIIPSIFIVFSNIFVVLRLRAHLKDTPCSPTVSFNTADTVYSTAGPSQTVKSTMISKASLCRPNSRFSLTKAELKEAGRCKRHSLRYADLQLTRSLLVVTTAFIMLNMPNYAYRIAIQILNISDQSVFMQRFSLAAHVLLYTHHAILFYLYIFYSPQMKKRLVPTALKLLECYCLKHVHDDTVHGN